MMRIRPALVGACLALALPLAAEEAEKPRPVTPNPSETIDCVRCKTGYTLPVSTFEGDALYYHTSLSNIHHDDIDLTGDSLLLSLAYGITDWATARAVLPLHRRSFDPGDVETGIGDIELDGKVSVKKDLSPIGFVPIVDVAFGFLIGLPTGDEDKGLGEGDAYFRPYASASYWFREWLGVHASGYFEFQSGDRPYHGASGTAELVPSMRELSLLATLELRQRGTQSPAFTFIPGAEYRLTQMLSVGLGFPLGLSSHAEDWGVLLNAQVRF